MRNDTPFNVMNHNNWDHAPRDPISAAIASYVTGTAFATGAAALAGGATLGWWAAYAVSTIAISAVTSKVLTALAPKPSIKSGTIVNAKEPAAFSQIVYGEVRKGGTVTFLETTGSKNKYLHQIIVLAGHEVEEIGDIYLNDKIVTMSDENVTSEPYKKTNKISEVLTDHVQIYKHLGNQTSASTPFANSTETLASTLHSETDVDSSFVGKGIAYLYCRFKFDKDVFANGLPVVSAVVKGKKVVKTINGVEQAPAYSNNAAWVIRDFLTSNYGLNAPDDIDYASFEAAADVCDDTSVISGNLAQYQINGVVGSEQSYGDVLNEMAAACGGTLYWGGGKYRFYAGEFVTPTKTLTMDDVRSSISIDTKISMRDQFNIVRGVFADKGNKYTLGDFPEVKSTLFINDDNGVERSVDMTLPYTTDYRQAQRIAKLQLYRNREQISFSADFGLNAFDVEVGDFINLDMERYGWGGGKTFEVIGWKLSPSVDTGEIRINLNLRESSSAAFSFDSTEEREILSNDSNLLNYYEVPEIGVTVSQEYREVNENVVNVLVADITSDSIENVDSVIVQYKKTVGGQYKSVGQSLLIGEDDDAGRFEIVGIDVPQKDEAPINYTIKVTPVNSLGFRGDTLTTTFNATADTTPPNAPTGFDHSLSGGTIFFTWDASTSLDLSHYKLYYSSNTSANLSGATEKISKIARPATSITHPALAGKYFLTAVDKTGNENLNAVTLLVNASELPQLGVLSEYDQHTSFSGTKTNTVVSSGELRLITDNDQNNSGYYYFSPATVDVGTSRTVRLSYDVEYTRKVGNAINGEVLWDAIPYNWDQWPDNWDDWSDETTDFPDYYVYVQARSSIDGSTYNSWQDASGELVGRYIQFRAWLLSYNPQVTPNITALTARVEY